jgi:hypothetical protein
VKKKVRGKIERSIKRDVRDINLLRFIVRVCICNPIILMIIIKFNEQSSEVCS